jgi:transposase
MVPVIPPKSKRTEPIDSDTDLYKVRQKVERFCNTLKQFRRIATRYEKLSPTLLAFIHLVAAWLIIK